MEIEAENIETTEIEQEKFEGKEEEKNEEKEDFDPILGSETSPEDTTILADITYQEVDATLTTLSTYFKTKRKRKTPMYFRTRKSQRVR